METYRSVKYFKGPFLEMIKVYPGLNDRVGVDFRFICDLFDKFICPFRKENKESFCRYFDEITCICKSEEAQKESAKFIKGILDYIERNL